MRRTFTSTVPGCTPLMEYLPSAPVVEPSVVPVMNTWAATSG
jgi:hypothetical protein